MRTHIIKINTGFCDRLLHANDERDVERAYASECERIGYKFTSAVGQKVDGILTALHKDFPEYAIAEFKYDENLTDRYRRSKILLQPMIYLYRMGITKSPIPLSCIIGDKNHCFSIDSQILRAFLIKHQHADWEERGLAPSNAYKMREDIVKLINDDQSIINPLIYNVSNPEVELKDIIDTVVKKHKTGKSNIKIVNENMVSVYSVFKNSVVNLQKERKPNESDSELDNRLVHVFFDILTDIETTTLNERGNGILNTRGDLIHVFDDQYHSFKNIYCGYKYTSSELAELVASKDILIEEMKRRRTGAFFTPSVWINKAYEMIAEQFGLDWKEKYVVWDCASGTNNLTRNYKFNELYNSTLEQGDINTVKNMRYGGITFQYDFLNNLNNDETELPASLIETLHKKKSILFLINPPYGTSGGKIGGKGNNKNGISNTTKINEQMKNDKIGACSDQLYAQFLYRILIFKKEYNLTDIKICIFSPPIFMSGSSYSKFREVFYNHFTFKSGMLFQANQFADVSGEWGISFTLWEGKLCN